MSGGGLVLLSWLHILSKFWARSWIWPDSSCHTRSEVSCFLPRVPVCPAGRSGWASGAPGLGTRGGGGGLGRVLPPLSITLSQAPPPPLAARLVSMICRSSVAPGKQKSKVLYTLLCMTDVWRLGSFPLTLVTSVTADIVSEVKLALSYQYLAREIPIAYLAKIFIHMLSQSMKIPRYSGRNTGLVNYVGKYTNVFSCFTA